MSDIFTAALVGGLIGTFFGGFTKFLWERWLPDWLTWRRTQRVDRDRQLAYIRAPALLAVSDLCFRLEQIIRSQGENYRDEKRRGGGDYYIDSTAYMIARVFAWQQVLRHRMASYDYVEIYKGLNDLSEAFSTGGPGFQVWRLEQAEIGERLAVKSDSDNVALLLYSEFLDGIEPNCPRWLSTLRKRVTHLYENPAEEKVRTERIIRALHHLLKTLDPKNRWLTAFERSPAGER